MHLNDLFPLWSALHAPRNETRLSNDYGMKSSLGSDGCQVRTPELKMNWSSGKVFISESFRLRFDSFDCYYYIETLSAICNWSKRRFYPECIRKYPITRCNLNNALVEWDSFRCEMWSSSTYCFSLQSTSLSGEKRCTWKPARPTRLHHLVHVRFALKAAECF